MTRSIKAGFILISFFMLIACNATFPETVESMELFLNQKVGTEYPKGDLNYDKPINEDSDYIELERKRKDGCSYAFLVNKKTNVIQKWRFTSERSLCRYVNPLYL